MEKPFTIRIKEFSEKLIEEINSSKLPVYVLKSEIEKVYAELNRIDEEDIYKYNESLSNENNQKSSKERTDEKWVNWLKMFVQKYWQAFLRMR